MISSVAFQVGGNLDLTPFASCFSQHAWHFPINGNFSARCVIQHLGLSEKYLGLFSVLEGSNSTSCVRHFRRRLQSCRHTWWPFQHDLIFLFCLIFSSVSDLVVWLLFSSALVWRKYWDILAPWFPVRKGLRSSWTDCFATTADIPGSLIPELWFCCSITNKISMGCLPL